MAKADDARMAHCTTWNDHSPACDRDGTYCSLSSSHSGPCKPHGSPSSDKRDLIAQAWTLRSSGQSLYAIAVALGVTKEWLRTYAGMTDR